MGVFHIWHSRTVKICFFVVLGYGRVNVVEEFLSTSETAGAFIIVQIPLLMNRATGKNHRGGVLHYFLTKNKGAERERRENE